MTVQDSLMINQVKAAQNHLQANLNLNRTAAVPIRINNCNISLSESQADIEQREAITKFLADGLRQLMDNYGNANSSRVMGSLAIKSSLVKIDLAALGITSLNIVVNIPDQNNMDGPSFGSKLMLHEPLVAQPEPYLLVPPAIAMNKPAKSLRCITEEGSKTRVVAMKSKLCWWTIPQRILEISLEITSQPLKPWQTAQTRVKILGHRRERSVPKNNKNPDTPRIRIGGVSIRIRI
jgi:hypothetical protein